MTDIERFLGYVNKTETCWLWTGGTCGTGPTPYGQFCAKSKNVRAHRFAYEQFVGPIPEGFLVCHRCDVTLCVNPEHLFVGTMSDNINDAVSKGRFSPVFPQPPWNKSITHCKQGHEFTPENTKLYGGQRRCRTCGKLWCKKVRLTKKMLAEGKT